MNRSIRSTLVRLPWLLWRAILQAFRRQSALRELQRLDAHMLEDMGLHRGQLWFIADAYARGVPIGDRHPRHRHDVASGQISMVPRITATQCPATDTCETDP
jgi:uncharacterized protein YjiS (DUF1127 family)